MDPTTILTISSAVGLLAQLVRWAAWFPSALAPLGVFLFSGLGVGLWIYSNPNEVGFYRLHMFDYFAAYVAVCAAAAGQFGFTQAAVDAANRARNRGRPPTDMDE